MLWKHSAKLITVGLALLASPPAAYAEGHNEKDAPPFAMACQDPRTRADAISVSYLAPKIPMADRQGISAKAFFNELVKQIEGKISVQRKLLDGFDNCLGPNPTLTNCAHLVSFAENDLPKIVKDARFHLALAQTDYEISTLALQANQQVNTRLDPRGTYKLLPWSPLSPDELVTAQTMLEKYRAEIDLETETRILSEKLPRPYRWSVQGKETFFDHDETRRFRNDALLTVRINHSEQYLGIMARLPLLQFISTAKPTRADLLAAVTAMRTKLDEEAVSIQRVNSTIQRGYHAGRGGTTYYRTLPNEAFWLLNYRRLMELVLVDKPEFCSIATTLLLGQGKRAVTNMALIGLPVLASGFILSPVISVPLGLAVGVGVTADSYETLQHAEAQYLPQVIANGERRELDAVHAASSSLAVDIVTFPLSFMGAQVAARQIGLKVGAALFGNQLSKNSKTWLRTQSGL